MVALFGSGWNAYNSHQQYSNGTQYIIRVQELRSQITLLDEILTMSARMAVLTGDLEWVQRYRSFEGNLVATNQEANALVPDLGGTEPFFAANDALIEMESNAFRLIRNEELEESREILFSEEYARQKVIFSEGLQLLDGELVSLIGSSLRSQRQQMLVQVFSIALVILILVISWLVVIRIIHLWRDELAQSVQHHIDLNRVLDHKVLVRTAFAQRSMEKAKQANKFKSEFLANMSHEFRTPMNVVLGYLEMLGHTSLDEEQKMFAGTARKAATSLLDIVNDILDFSKIEAGQLSLESIPLDLNEVVEEVIALLEPLASAKGTQLQSSVSKDVPKNLSGDPLRIRQILINLINNAIKFTSEGEVSVNVGLEKETENHLVLRFDVHDTGIGISADKQEMLFEAFTQEYTSTARKFGGTGLGLAISKQLAELMGGEIGVNSTVREGATFWFTAKIGKIDKPV